MASSAEVTGRSTLELLQCAKLLSDRVTDTVRIIQTASMIARLPKLTRMHANQPPKLFYLQHELSVLTDVKGCATSPPPLTDSALLHHVGSGEKKVMTFSLFFFLEPGSKEWANSINQKNWKKS